VLVFGLGLPALGTFTSETYSICKSRRTLLLAARALVSICFFRIEIADVQCWQIPRRVSAYG